MIFIKNKYSTWYFQIIENARINQRKKSKIQYYENHHIIPSSLGGSSNKTNLVLLTAREHFIVHLLLTKMLTGKPKYKMSFALSMLSNIKNIGKGRYIPTSRLYEYAKLGAKKAREDYWTPERRLIRSKQTKENSKFKQPVSEETKEKHRNKVWTQKALDSRLKNCLKNAADRKGKPWSENKRKSNRLNYLKKNYKNALNVAHLFDSGVTNYSALARELNISWEKVKWALVYRNEFEEYAKKF